MRQRSISLVSVLLGLHLAAQDPSWRRPVFPGLGSQLCHHAARGVTLMLCSNPANAALVETWSWDGATWSRRPSAVQPPMAPMAYDSKRGLIQLVGPRLSGSPYQAKLYSWNGSQWSEQLFTTGPLLEGGRSGIAYDAGRDRLITFGGLTGGVGWYGTQTWEWDGTSWTQRFPLHVPSQRGDAPMVYDPALRLTVMQGGRTKWLPLDDTWVWDGIDWTDVSSSSRPIATGGQIMVYDAARARRVLFDGTDTWESNVLAWTKRTTAHRPPTRYMHGVAYDVLRQRVVLFGGYSSGFGSRDDLWEFDGVDWVERSAETRPLARWDHSLSWDRAREVTVLFGGYAPGKVFGDTWEHDGASWQRRSPPTSPPARYDHAASYDAGQRRLLVYGGQPGLADTWSYDGTDWQQLTPPGATPGKRFDHAMCYDDARERVVLFGGNRDGQLVDDTWEWDGATWRDASPLVRPPARWNHALCYDSLRKRAVLFGGENQGGFLRDHWEWDGVAWKQVPSPTIGPPARGDHGLAYDQGRDRVVVFGGRGPGAMLDVWEWDGRSWRTPSLDPQPDARLVHAMTYDARRARIVMFGGHDANGQPLGDYWEFGVDNAATYTSLGHACLGSLGRMRLSALHGARPILGRPFTAQVEPIPTTAPALMLIGASHQVSLGMPLPIDLGSVGMTGCTLEVSSEILGTLALPDGPIATWMLGIPLDTALLGALMCNQVFARDPAANPAGWITSNAAVGVIGLR